MEVLVGVSKGVVDSLLEKFKGLLENEYTLLAGARGDLLHLRSELETMRAFLEDVALLDAPSALDKDWTRQVRELAYDVEDSIDDFTRCVDQGGPAGFLGAVSRFVYTLAARRQIAGELRELRTRALDVRERRSRYSSGTPRCPGTVSAGASAADPTDRLLPAVYTEAAALVGIAGPRDEIIGLVGKEPYGRRHVVSVLGFAGMGKTTLAMAVYRHLECQFQCRAFVTVSRNSLKSTLREVLQQVVGSVERVETWELRQLVHEIRHHLEKKRYLVIIDDLWTSSAWEEICYAFPENHCGSTVITTTRIESVAMTCCSGNHRDVYRIRALNNLDSRTLFFGRIFGSEDDCPHELEEVSKQILKKCAGLPLAIFCISGLLRSRRTRTNSVWEKVCNSLGSELETNDILSGLKQAISLGYDDLPHHLKVCLLYLSAFPEDSRIERHRLMRRWIAEGFVSEQPGRNVEETAEHYFNELIDRSMIQAVDIDCFSEVHACRIHDVILELITIKSFEENFMIVVGGHRGAFRSDGHVRRLSLDCSGSIDGLKLASMNLSHARSLTIYGDFYHVPPIPDCRFLRVLDFECCEGIESSRLTNIGDLFLVRFLSLKNTWISELPKQIGELKYLETLDLTRTNIRELPVEITRLQRLVHLLAGGAELPQGVGNMKALQMLSIRATDHKSKAAVKELVGLANLTKLDMSYLQQKERKYWDKRQSDTLPSSISKLSNSKLGSLHLHLLGYSLGLSLDFLCAVSPPTALQRLQIKGDYYFLGVPRWMASLGDLKDLELTIAGLDEGELRVLGELPMLIRLKLTLQDPSEQGIVIREPGFLSLKLFFLDCRATSLSFDLGVMPKLEKLELWFRASREALHSTHLSVEHLQSLGEVQFVMLCSNAQNSGIEVVKDSIKSAVNRNSNKPSLKMYMNDERSSIP